MIHQNFVTVFLKHCQMVGLYMESQKMTFDKKRGVMRCGQAVIKNSPKKKYSKKIKLSLI